MKIPAREQWPLLLLLLVMLSFLCAVPASAGVNIDKESLRMGMPWGGSEPEEADYDKCPRGVRVVSKFFIAWKNKDYRTMYDLISEESKKGYSFEQARLDFRFLKFKPYKISSIRKAGNNYEFLLSYGDWEYGDKDTKKMIIDGDTYKIIMPEKGSPFKRSIDSYF